MIKIVEKIKSYRREEVIRKMYNNRYHWYLKKNNTLVNGVIVDLYKNSKRKLEYHVKDGMFHGASKGWMKNGKLRYHENWRNHLPHLKQFYYDEEGNLIQIKELYNGCNIQFRTFNKNTNNWDKRVFCDSYQFNLFDRF